MIGELLFDVVFDEEVDGRLVDDALEVVWPVADVDEAGVDAAGVDAELELSAGAVTAELLEAEPELVAPLAADV